MFSAGARGTLTASCENDDHSVRSASIEKIGPPGAVLTHAAPRFSEAGNSTGTLASSGAEEIIGATAMSTAGIPVRICVTSSCAS